MLMLHRLARSGDIPLPTPPSEALDCNSPPITNETCFRIGKAGGAVSTASSSRSDREHALRTPATKPTTAPTRLKTFLKILNKPTRHSSPLTIDIPPSSPIRPATVQSTPIYDRFAGTASQEDQHKSTTTPGVPTSAYEEDVEPPHLCSNKASVEKHEMHPTSLTPLHDEDFDSVSNYSTDLGGEVVAAPPAHGSAALSTPPRPPTSSTSTSCRFERNSESVSESAGSHSDAKNDSVEGNDGKRNSDELSYSTDYHWDARSLVLLRVLLRTGRCQVGRSSEVRVSTYRPAWAVWVPIRVSL
ncbi:BQ2448_615 [Microbotryum intermedium]|uniref:BQ2448_615 protein n=1 Tax=Microbotryum intermedium TaxID=269621 RepID=A0A238F9F8_9BASI|nr:BQ2448_615 [Microbotryum intermedium]